MLTKTVSIIANFRQPAVTYRENARAAQPTAVR